MRSKLALLGRLSLTLGLIVLFVPAAILGLIANVFAGALIATAEMAREQLDAMWAADQ
jgi:hypothetical protein